MEIFLPSLLIILLAAVVVFTILPRMGPIVLTVLSIVLLLFGVSHHYKMFYDEYRLATWYKSASFLAPALVLGVTLFFILGFILSFFGVNVPVPAAPAIPSLTEITNVATSAVNTVKNSVANTVGNATSTVGNVTRNLNNSLRFNGRNTVGSLANRLP